MRQGRQVIYVKQIVKSCFVRFSLPTNVFLQPSLTMTSQSSSSGTNTKYATLGRVRKSSNGLNKGMEEKYIILIHLNFIVKRNVIILDGSFQSISHYKAFGLFCSIFPLKMMNKNPYIKHTFVSNK